jgi:dolichol-phosphate mannosyltransferase
MIRALYSQGATMCEVPIHFIERRAGKSKMSANIAVEAFFRVSVWGFQRILRPDADKLYYVK